MLSKKICEALNEQLNFELYSGYIYHSMRAALEGMNLPGSANWMDIQTQEEVAHSQKLFDYINERDGQVELEAIPKPQSEWKTARSIFEHAYKHEQIVTGRINNLADLAQTEKDFATANFLLWFIAEQVEEESNVKKIVDRLKLAGDAPQAMFMIDNELAQRVFTPPTTA